MPVELAGQYYLDGADEVLKSLLLISFNYTWILMNNNALQVSFLNITGFHDFLLCDSPMLQVCPLIKTSFGIDYSLIDCHKKGIYHHDLKVTTLLSDHNLNIGWPSGSVGTFIY